MGSVMVVRVVLGTKMGVWSLERSLNELIRRANVPICECQGGSTSRVYIPHIMAPTHLIGIRTTL